MKKYSHVRWRIWSILTFSFVLTLFLRTSTGVIADDLINELGFTSLQISTIASCNLYAYAIMQIPAGLLIDKYGPRKVTSVGMIVGGIGSIIFGFIQSVELAYFARVLMGAGTSVIMLSLFEVQGNWFKREEFGSLTSKFSFIGNLGNVMATFPLVYITQSIGWRNCFSLIGIIGILIGIGAYLLIRDLPTEYGFEVVNEGDEEVFEKVNLVEGLKSVLANKSTWYNSFIMLSLVGSATALTSLWGIRYIVDVYEVEKTVAAVIMSFFTYGFVFGSVTMDFVFNKIKGSKFIAIQIGGCVNLAIWVYAIILCKMKPPIGVWALLFFLMGTITMSHLQTFNDVKYKNNKKYSSLATSLVNSCEFVGSGLLNLFIAYFIQANSSNLMNGYKMSFISFIVLSIVTITCATIGRKNDTSQKEMKIETN